MKLLPREKKSFPSQDERKLNYRETIHVGKMFYMTLVKNKINVDVSH